MMEVASMHAERPGGRGRGAEARRKAAANGWRNVTLVEADVASLDPAEHPELSGEFDAAVCMLGLSVIPAPEVVYERLPSARAIPRALPKPFIATSAPALVGAATIVVVTPLFLPNRIPAPRTTTYSRTS
jgi:hypothetical protein